MVKATDFKFDTRVSRVILDIIRYNLLERERGQAYVTPKMLNAYNSKMVRAVNFKFNLFVPKSQKKCF